jgi:hypothetical protein
VFFSDHPVTIVGRFKMSSKDCTHPFTRFQAFLANNNKASLTLLHNFKLKDVSKRLKVKKSFFRIVLKVKTLRNLSRTNHGIPKNRQDAGHVRYVIIIVRNIL